MELAEAAAVIGTTETVRVYFGQELTTVSSALESLHDLSDVMGNFTREFSPISMNKEWPWMWRFFILILFACTGTILNAFFISSFFISQELKKKANIFLACLGFSDLVITALVVPTALVIMLSQVKETTLLCQFLQFLTQLSTYSYSMFFMLMAIDMHIRLVRGCIFYRKITMCHFGSMAALNFVISLGTAGVGVYYGLDYDYCHRQHHGNYWFRLGTTMAFYVFPSIITTYLLFDTSYVMNARIIKFIRYKRYRNFGKDRDLANLHLTCHILFVAAWTPYLVLVNIYPDTSDAKYYAFIWIGLVRSSITCLLYGTMNDHFRQAFQSLFVYCFCKGFSARLFNSRQRISNVSKEENVQVPMNMNEPAEAIMMVSRSRAVPAMPKM